MFNVFFSSLIQLTLSWSVHLSSRSTSLHNKGWQNTAQCYRIRTSHTLRFAVGKPSKQKDFEPKAPWHTAKKARLSKIMCSKVLMQFITFLYGCAQHGHVEHGDSLGMQHCWVKISVHEWVCEKRKLYTRIYFPNIPYFQLSLSMKWPFTSPDASRLSQLFLCCLFPHFSHINIRVSGRRWERKFTTHMQKTHCISPCDLWSKCLYVYVWQWVYTDVYMHFMFVYTCI